jgi:RNA polymerase sigma-70 factor (ECF subfamily)
MGRQREARAAFERLYDEQFEAVFRYVLLRTGSVAEAEDLTSQTFFKALRGFWRMRWTGAPPSAWLFRIATNEVNSHFRRRRRRARWEAAPPTGREPVAREVESAQERLERDELFRELARALGGLAPDEQALVVLRYFEGKSFSEIARILGRREGTLAMRTHRALGKLRIELEKRGISHEGIREEYARRALAGSPGDPCPGVPAGAAR